jgi:UDP-N-acetylglucosamine 2-epimerase
MKKLKVMTVVGTRPEIIRLSRVISRLDELTSHVLVHTGQNYDYELNQIFFEQLHLRAPDHFLNAIGNSTAATIGNIIGHIDPLLEREKPDAFLVLGDTNSGLSVISAKRRKIPIFHMEAGNRCFDLRVPEEINRKIIDHTSDINLPYSDLAREYLIKENFAPDQIIKTGSPMFEVLNHFLPEIEASRVVENLALQKGNYFVVSAHREENIDSEKNFQKLIDCLHLIGDFYQLPILFSAHPRTRKRIESSGITLHRQVTLSKPLGFLDYVKLQINARAVLSDSGTITEESSILGFPAINIREAHERPEGMEEAAVILTGLNPDRIMTALQWLSSERKIPLRPIADYSMPNVSEKVCRIILSYTDYVNRKVWSK